MSEASVSDTLLGVLRAAAERDPHSVALLSPGRSPIVYGELLDTVLTAGRVLREQGLGCRDRIALIARNGPEMAASFLALAACAPCAPLNPAYRESELDWLFGDLGVKAVVVDSLDSPAAVLARQRQLAVIQLSSAATVAGRIELIPDGVSRAPAAGHDPQPSDVALLLHTSGTTARPKMVPLTHANLCASARHIAAALALATRDRCLNVMPLFHVHGLVGALLSSISVGASVICMAGYDTEQFWAAMETSKPTWFTAVPTIHTAIVDSADAHREAMVGSTLRFVRSCSARLPAALMTRIETVFAVPAIEAFGMTEASHQVTSNPLPPGVRKPDSVGLATGTEVAVRLDGGAIVARGATGELVIRGPNVTAGYEANPAANEAAFTGGWFRTGDQAFIDEDGYVFVTGRLKEIINRGGEKISPREVDDVLLSHPAVAEAVAIAVPHATLGEDVAAVVSLRPSHVVSGAELRRFAALHLAEHKIPTRLFFQSVIPRGPTGKIQRIELARRMLQEQQSAFVAPRNPTEAALSRIWAAHLRHDAVGVDDNYFELGGDSLVAATIVAEAAGIGLCFTPEELFGHPTIAELATCLTGDRRGNLPPPRLAVPGTAATATSPRQGKPRVALHARSVQELWDKKWRARAKLNVYPFEYAIYEDVERVMTSLTSYAPDPWVAAFSAVADTYAEAAHRAEQDDNASAARDAYLRAYAYLRLARFPTIDSPAKKAAYPRSQEMYLRAARFFQVPLERVVIPFRGRPGEGDKIVGYLRLPRPPEPDAECDRRPLVVFWGGLDTFKEEFDKHVAGFLAAGLPVLLIDMPGSGDAPVFGSLDAERMFEAALDWVPTRRELDPERVCFYGASYGGYWAAKVAHTHRARLACVVNHGGGIHGVFEPEWMERSQRGEYPFHRLETQAYAFACASVDDWVELAPRLSLLRMGLLDQPCAPMLIVNGTHDTSVPIEDTYLALEHGSPKTGRLYPRGHMGLTADTLPTIVAWVRSRLERAG